MKKTLLIIFLLFFATEISATGQDPGPDPGRSNAKLEIKEFSSSCIQEPATYKIAIYAIVESTFENVNHSELINYKPKCELNADELGLENAPMDKIDTHKDIRCENLRCSGEWKIKYKKESKIPYEDIIHAKIRCYNEAGIEKTAKNDFDISECKKNDTYAPVTIVKPTKSELESWYNGPINVKLECSDYGGVGCKSVFYYKVGVSESGFADLWTLIKNNQNDLSPLKDTLKDSDNTEVNFTIKEPTLIVFASEDVAKNFEKPQYIYVKIDKKSPITEYSGPFDENVMGSATIILSCSDPSEWPMEIDLQLSSGCKKTMYKVDSSNWMQFLGKIEVSQAGCHTISFYSEDNASNKEALMEKNFCIQQTAVEPLKITSGPNVTIKDYDSVEITWSTNKNADSIVSYGTSSNLELTATGNAGITHAVQIYNLSEKTTYYYKVISNAEGEKIESQVLSFTTPAKEPEELKIVDCQISASDTSATIAWQTNINASCDISLWEIGKEAQSIHVSDNEVKHITSLKSLAEKTTYSYRISCYSGALSTSKEGSFTTLSKEESTGGEKKVDIEQPFYPGETFGSIDKSATVSLKPKINGLNVTPSTASAYESELFRFDVDIDFSKSGFEYIWDFGDGTSLKTTDASAYHAYILEGTNQQEFIVKVFVTDKSTGAQYGKAEAKVIVRKAELKIKVIEPSTGTMLPKDKEVTITVAFLSANNEVLSPTCITRYEAYAGSEKLYSKFVENLLVIKYNPRLVASNYELIKVKASGNVEGRTVDIINYIPLHFSPLQLTILGNPFENKKYYFGSKISPPLYRMEFLLKPNTKITKMHYIVATLEGESYRERVATTISEYASFFDISHKITEDDVKRGLYLKLEGKDIYGNILSEKLPIFAAKDNPAFDLVIHNKEKLVAMRGQTVNIEASIQSINGLQGKVSFECEGKIAENASYDAEKNIYSFAFKVPDNYSSTKIDCIARASDSKGLSYEDFEEFSIPVISDIYVEFLSPKPGINVVSHPLDTIELDIKDSRGMPIEESLEGFITIDGNRFAIKIERFGQRHIAKIPQPIGFGEHSIKLEIQKPAYHLQELVVKLVMGLSSLEIAMIAVFFVIIAYLSYRLSKYWEERRLMRKQLELEAENLRALMNRLKVEYFKKHIEMHEFNERYSEAQKRLREIRALLGLKNKR